MVTSILFGADHSLLQFSIHPLWVGVLSLVLFTMEIHSTFVQEISVKIQILPATVVGTYIMCILWKKKKEKKIAGNQSLTSVRTSLDMGGTSSSW